MARNSILFEDFLRRGMDARVKPAHDEVAAWKKSLVVQARFPDAVPKARLRASATRNGAALAERCTAEPGPLRTPALVTIPVQRSSASRCIAPGKRDAVMHPTNCSNSYGI